MITQSLQWTALHPSTSMRSWLVEPRIRPKTFDISKNTTPIIKASYMKWSICITTDIRRTWCMFVVVFKSNDEIPPWIKNYVAHGVNHRCEMSHASWIKFSEKVNAKMSTHMAMHQIAMHYLCVLLVQVTFSTRTTRAFKRGLPRCCTKQGDMDVVRGLESWARHGIDRQIGQRVQNWFHTEKRCAVASFWPRLDHANMAAHVRVMRSMSIK